jgi:hypothetical protein
MDGISQRRADDGDRLCHSACRNYGVDGGGHDDGGFEGNGLLRERG